MTSSKLILVAATVVPFGFLVLACALLVYRLMVRHDKAKLAPLRMPVVQQRR